MQRGEDDSRFRRHRGAAQHGRDCLRRRDIPGQARGEFAQQTVQPLAPQQCMRGFVLPAAARAQAEQAV
jgi:hypothetical protein